MRTRTVLSLIAVAGVVVLLSFVWDKPSAMAALRQAGPVPFFAVMAVAPALGVPLTPFFLLAGAGFGVVVGLVGSAVALAVNLCLCFWIARSALERPLRSLLARFRYQLPSFAAGGTSAARFAVLVKLAPGLPAAVKHYALALAGVPFAIYFVVSMLVTGIYAGTIVLLGESALDRDVTGTLVAGALVVVVGVLVAWWRSRVRAENARLPTRGATSGRAMGEPTGSV